MDRISGWTAAFAASILKLEQLQEQIEIPKPHERRQRVRGIAARNSVEWLRGNRFLLYPFPIMEDQTPATKADIERLEASMKVFTSSVERSIRSTADSTGRLSQNLSDVSDRMDDRFDGVRERTDEILDVLVNVDRRLTEATQDYDRRLRRLERHVGIAK